MTDVLQLLPGRQFSVALLLLVAVAAGSSSTTSSSNTSEHVPLDIEQQHRARPLVDRG
eukprot:CAMPEP_0170184426 /NCGR_PEP_ID=MMETSP0040_2-20121228/33580_1 /TAXON_ID=641309 /ORGANISM="Lotharella oceanica, Strain CCMP622" /LENGTH=57 /DNA_ID=CAMNT_0010430491 /DNA_START=41 /DNA_END=210 /DNA_ORIENTATION=+